MAQVFEAPNRLVMRAVSHYSVAILAAVYRLVLSLDQFGNVRGRPHAQRTPPRRAHLRSVHC